MEDRSDLVRLAFRLRALTVEVEDLDRLLNEIVAPRMRDASTSLRAIQAQLRELAGVERIDMAAADRVAGEIDGEAEGGAVSAAE